MKLVVSAVLCAGCAMAASFAIPANNGPNSSFPYLGAIDGFANNSNDLGVGSFNYAYLGGTTLTAPGVGPTAGANSFSVASGFAEDFETSIWSINGSNGVSAQWVNTDLSTPTTFLVLFQNILLITGDLTAFGNTFGAYEQVSFTYFPTGGGSGYLEVFDANTSVDLGSVANLWNPFGEYGALTSTSTNQLSVAVATTAAPEPSTLAFLGLGLGALGLIQKRVRG